MRECGEIFALLSEFLDEELPPEQMREFEAHICACVPCVAFIESLRKSRDACRKMDCTDAAAGPVPDELMGRIREMYRSFKTSASVRTE